jgi:hypothetical protein
MLSHVSAGNGPQSVKWVIAHLLFLIVVLVLSGITPILGLVVLVGFGLVAAQFHQDASGLMLKSSPRSQFPARWDF